MITKKAIAKGAFLPVAERRAFAESESRLQHLQARYAGLVARLQTDELKGIEKRTTNRIHELYADIIEKEDQIFGMRKQLENIERFGPSYLALQSFGGGAAEAPPEA